jgi:hypothetical protein
MKEMTVTTHSRHYASANFHEPNPETAVAPTERLRLVAAAPWELASYRPNASMHSRSVWRALRQIIRRMTRRGRAVGGTALINPATIQHWSWATIREALSRTFNPTS